MAVTYYRNAERAGRIKRPVAAVPDPKRAAGAAMSFPGRQPMAAVACLSAPFAARVSGFRGQDTSGAAHADHAWHEAGPARRQAVARAWHSAGLALGARHEGGPSLRRHYHPHFRAPYPRDPDGHQSCCVCHRPETEENR
jgi:hypothetical protein